MYAKYLASGAIGVTGAAIAYIETQVPVELVLKLMGIAFFAGMFYLSTLGAIKDLNKRVGNIEELLVLMLRIKSNTRPAREQVAGLLEGLTRE